jgi:branched-chain amino acid transport system substrate-binding protein
VFSAYGYIMMDIMIQAAQKAGPQLTTESFVKAMNSLTVPSDIFGTPKLTYTATKRLGSESSRLSQIQDGKWKTVANGK